MMRSVTGRRSRRLTSGFDCHGRSNCSEKLCGRLWRAMCRMSRKPRVVIMPTSAPARSITMLVATVVPWNTASIAPGSTPASPQTLRMPCTTPSDWSCGVLETLVTTTCRSAPSPDRSSTMSVNVPPTSTPTRIMPRLRGKAAAWEDAALPTAPTLRDNRCEPADHARHGDATSARMERRITH